MKSSAISGKKEAGLKVGLYGDIAPVQDDTPHEWRVYALDKKTGSIRWQRTVLTAVPKIKRHTKATHANSTLATDGEHIIGRGVDVAIGIPARGLKVGGTE